MMQTRRGPFYYNEEDKICKKSSAKIYISKIKGKEGFAVCAPHHDPLLHWGESQLQYTALNCTYLYFLPIIHTKPSATKCAFSHRALWFCESPLHLNICCFPGILRFSTKFRGVFAASLQTHSIYALPDLQWNFFIGSLIKIWDFFRAFSIG